MEHRDTFFMTPERVEEEIINFIKDKEFSTKPEGRIQSLQDIYIFQPAISEAIQNIVQKKILEDVKILVDTIKEFIQKCPYNVEEKQEIIWALELLEMSPDTSFVKLLNAAKARKHKIHSVLR